MWEATSTTATLATVFSSIGTILTYGLVIVVTAAAALMGAGYLFRLTKKHVTGKKI